MMELGIIVQCAHSRGRSRCVTTEECVIISPAWHGERRKAV